MDGGKLEGVTQPLTLLQLLYVFTEYIYPYDVLQRHYVEFVYETDILMRIWAEIIYRKFAKKKKKILKNLRSFLQIFFS